MFPDSFFIGIDLLISKINTSQSYILLITLERSGRRAQKKRVVAATDGEYGIVTVLTVLCCLVCSCCHSNVK